MPSDPLHAIVIFLCFLQALVKYGAHSLAHSCWEAPEGFDSWSASKDHGYQCHKVNGAGRGGSCGLLCKEPLLLWKGEMAVAGVWQLFVSFKNLRATEIGGREHTKTHLLSIASMMDLDDYADN